VLDGAEGDYVEGLSDGLGARVLYIDVRQCKSAGDFAQEGRFLVIGFDEGQGDVGGPKLDRNAGEAGADPRSATRASAVGRRASASQNP